MAESLSKNIGATVRCSIYSDGEPIGDSWGLISVHIFKGVNRIGRATLVFEAGDMPEANVPESEDETFEIGKIVRIEAGYDDEETTLFEGMVIGHNVKILEGNRGTLQVECCDYAFQATLCRKSRVFIEATDSMAISEILDDYPVLTASVGSTGTTYGELVQYYCTDWDFILSRADANGLVVLTDGADISVNKPQTGADPLLSVKYGRDIIEFRGELMAFDQVAGIEASAWDAVKQEMISGKGDTPSLNDQGSGDTATIAGAVGAGTWNIATVSAVDEESLAAWADSQFLKTGLSRIRGSIKFYGSAKARPGSIIEVDGFGKRFNGNAYIGTMEHEIRNGDWITTVGMGIPAGNITDNPSVPSPAASGFLPGIHGLHIGKVTKLDGDPLQNHRVQVQIPSLNTDNNILWARLGGFWASPGYGAFFIPDVGDEVTVGFFNGDPCYPVILGSLYSAKQSPPCEMTQENNMRAIVTRENMKILFDEEKKAITIETPGGNKINISDDGKGICLTDQNSNTFEMNDSGILIKSPKDIVIKSDKNVNIEAGAGTKINAASDLNIKGLNVEIKADAGLTAKGTANAEFSASGNTVVKGAMVMIN